MALGIPAEELEAFPIRELARYSAFEKVHGPLWIGDRLDILFAQLTWAVAKLGGSDAEDPRPFLPEWDEGARDQTDEDIIAALQAWKLHRPKE